MNYILFLFLRNFDEIPYEIKKPSGQDRTAAEGECVAEATRRRRRILQNRILYAKKGGKIKNDRK